MTDMETEDLRGVEKIPGTDLFQEVIYKSLDRKNPNFTGRIFRKPNEEDLKNSPPPENDTMLIYAPEDFSPILLVLVK